MFTTVKSSAPIVMILNQLMWVGVQLVSKGLPEEHQVIVGLEKPRISKKPLIFLLIAPIGVFVRNIALCEFKNYQQI